ncbi:DISARM system helicase DrmA [Brachybacterium sp. sponge]|uniref:DISARM system helicase DrmA n=1 Tax=Brachybacterium sp. sponge TaxID=1775432 RepID=UPI0007A38A7B|nr:DISARM system helicase DrmA [Brachybacterium sp. sponge]
MSDTTHGTTDGSYSERLLGLSYAPDGTSWTDRENLTDLLQRDLLGPTHGDDELLDAQPDSLYLVGRIAPAKLEGTASDRPVTQGVDDDADEEIIPALEARLGRGVPAGNVDEDTAGNEDEGAEDVPLRRGLMIPASMGLRFQVPLDQETVTVHASWGSYRPETALEDPSDPPKAGERPRRKYRRTQHVQSRRVNLTSFIAGKTAELLLEDRIVLRIDTFVQGSKRIIEISLCNDRETPRKIPVDAWLYQTRLDVDAGGDAVFLPVRDILLEDTPADDDEEARLELQYRNRLEFAIGRTCSADWTAQEGQRRATQVRTTWLPVSETPQTQARDVDGAQLDMTVLEELSTPQNAERLKEALLPIVVGYDDWLSVQEAESKGLPLRLRKTAETTISTARITAKRLRHGVDFLTQDEEALRCFAFMNHVMAEQRLQSQVVELRSAGSERDPQEARRAVEAKGPRAHSWRVFQLAFILLQIRALVQPDHERRSGDLAQAELLFFPTGGGKTEAYLGLAAFTFAIRRRQGVRDTPEGPIDGLTGVSVLMRYTLRLLTAQQFQRATAMVCAAELERRNRPEIWGTEPFRIGLWVGSAVSPKRYEEAREQLENAAEGKKYGFTILQFERCPWCGTEIGPQNVMGDDTLRRVFVRCADRTGQCPFSVGAQVEEGLPVLTVDEEIYRLVPAFVIATVDKFARLVREGEASSLFGYPQYRCDRHGFVHDDSTSCTISVNSKHRREKAGTGQELPAASKRLARRLRPPDLIIQDELHLITGALGTVVGAFEVAIDVMSTWTDGQGRQVRPLVVASSATVRRAEVQIRNLYGRGTAIFPPQVLDVADTYFSRELPISRETPGRRYIGISTTGVRLTAAEIAVSTSLLSSGQLLLDTAVAPTNGAPVSTDPYLTLVGYFNATRELAGMARYVADDVQTALKKRRPGKFFPLRWGTAGGLNVAELTSRAGSSEINETLDQMGTEFDHGYDTSAEFRKRSRDIREGRKPSQREGARPIDVVLATSMLQVGVDVTRLGLMLMVGQPKNTAEYIQATSRVGRDPSRPGLVVTLGNWARPRDLAHFEQFRHYHETFYSQVEPLSVTPFSETALDRTLSGVLLAAVRVMDAQVKDGLSPEAGADRIRTREARVEELIDRLAARADLASTSDASHDSDGAFNVRDEVRFRLINRLDKWRSHRSNSIASQRHLVYERIGKKGDKVPLIRSLEDVPNSSNVEGVPFPVANSMREVQPEINILVSPVKERLQSPELENAPAWTASAEKGENDD